MDMKFIEKKMKIKENPTRPYDAQKCQKSIGFLRIC